MRGIERPRARQRQYEGLAAASEGADARRSEAAPYGLSEREFLVLHLLTDGLSDKQIALAIGVTNHTINKHVGAILAKMNVRSRTAAAVTAIRQHLFDDEDAAQYPRRNGRSRGMTGPHGPLV